MKSMIAVISCHFAVRLAFFRVRAEVACVCVCVYAFLPLSVRILKKTDNAVATIDDYSVEIDLLNSEPECDVTFKPNLIG